jgi:hypothetical protein
MKTITYFTGICIVSILLLNACTKKDIATYEQDARINFRIPGEFDPTVSRDSLIYSFPFHPAVTEKDTIWLEASIMGNTTQTDREVGVRIDPEGTTAKENIDFKIINKVVPAGAFKGNIPIVIYKTPAIKDASVRLQLSVVENENFKVGYARNAKAVFIWGDKFLKPDNWDNSNYALAFGSPFSQKRTQFILDSCRITNLPDPNNRAIMGYYNQVLRNALNNYNRGKAFSLQLKDENGTPVFIPTFGGPGLG